ncbi:MAG: ATP-dependent sacrificial sulfur transferase LarE [Proteobacteria bacterium]|jgi:pyridinium-3,5-biscarboxylic acid mononucleotide sulfurtransferase|nr:ATP-dependent sacrificial sulfur transferase LarE [Pseudomonadota bacterium]
MSLHSTTTSSLPGQPADRHDRLSAGHGLPAPEQLESLKHWLREHSPVAVALSGGVDSALLASLAFEVLGQDAVSVTGISPSLSSQELDAARELSASVGIRHLEVETLELSLPGYQENAGNRCYFCKSELYGVILESPELKEFTVIDGTQASDDVTDRPGAAAALERGVLSPLRMFGFQKTHIRSLAKQRGLSSHDRPARPCLASRIPVGTRVNEKLLRRIETLEAVLSGEGFSVYRARCEEDRLVVEIAATELNERKNEDWRTRLDAVARRLGFSERWLDLRGYGGAGEPILEALVRG